jgi:hypothetical protein
MNQSLLTRQALAIKELIETMSATNGYNLEWGTVNQRNYALGDFPRAEIYYPSEENLDTLAGIGSRDYTNAVTFEIHVAAKLNFSSDNPLFEINEQLDYALDDLKMLFGKNPSIGGTCDSFLYRGYKRETKAVDQFIPTKMVTTWRAVYQQDRQTPSQVSSS